MRLMEHQRYAVAMMKALDYLLLAYDLGTGKTMCVLAYLIDEMREGRVGNALIICPASLERSWAQEIERCSQFEDYTEEDVERLKESVTITSYNRTYRTVRNNGVKSRCLRDEVDREWDVVVADEGQALSGHSSVQGKACLEIAKMSKKRFLLSATPLHGGHGTVDYSKMFMEIQFLTAGTKWKNWTEYCKKYVTQYNKWFVPTGFREEECAKIFADASIVCRREDCLDLPGYTETSIPCDLTEEKVYKDLKKGDVEQYGLKIDTSGTIYLKMLQLCSGSIKRETDVLTFSTSKDDALATILEGTDEPIVIFCNFRASIDRCVEICHKCMRSTVVYDGRSKTETWESFQNGEKDVIITQYQAGSAGLNLQRANICIFYEPTLSALALEQASGRIYRKGQSKKCAYYYLTTPDTIESRVWGVVRDGRDVSNEMLARLA